MSKITESEIEELAIELLEDQGFEYYYGSDIAPDLPASGNAQVNRNSFEDVVLHERLEYAVGRLNSDLPAEARAEAVRQVMRIQSPDMIVDNELFHKYLTEGVTVHIRQDGSDRGKQVRLVDFDDPDNNEFLVVNQFTIKGEHHNKRPDIILFVNGLPLVVIELKNPIDEKARIESAYKQLQTYKQAIPNLFTYNGLLVISDGLQAKAGSLSAGLDRFMAWPACMQPCQGSSARAGKKDEYYIYIVRCEGGSNYIGHTSNLEQRWNQHLNGEGADWTKVNTPLEIIHYEVYGTREEASDREKWLKTGYGRKWVKREIAAGRNKPYQFEMVPVRASRLVGQMETLIKGMLNKETLLDLVRHYIVFEESKYEDKQTGTISIKRVKKLAAYHQYYAVSKAVEATLKASADNGDRKGGVVWHTQGSGKSLSMVFYAGKIVQKLDNPTVVVITDRNDLDDQLFGTFASCKQLLRQEPVQADSRGGLKDLLKVASGGVVFTTIHKFQPEEGNVYETLSERQNIVVIADEAHRTQYGFKARERKVKDADGNEVGSEVVYGLAKYLRDALPNATYLGFTGTPIEKDDKNTPAVFGSYIDIYDIAQAVEDGATVPIYYESRLAKVELSDEGAELINELDEELDEELDKQDLDYVQKAKAKWTQLESLVGSPDRLKKVAADIVEHFEQRQEVFEGKGMIVTMSRRIAAELYKEIVALKPGWHNDELAKGSIKVVMTTQSSDGPEMAQHCTSKQQRRELAERMKDVHDELKLSIVCDMWLTGFDAPSMHTMYIDKPMKGHNLMQAIARVNRVYKDKPGGLVVDYLGIASDLKKALAFYSDSGGRGDPTIQQDKAVEIMLERLEVISQMYHGFAYEEYFDADTSGKLSVILAAEDHILGLQEGKKRYIDEVTKLSKAFAVAIPHDQAMDVKDEVAFFQAVKARLVKFDCGGGPGMSDQQMETAIRQVVDKALVTKQVIDIFDAAGIKKPDISILSDEFLMEVKGMEHKNVALEILKKLLSDEIRSRAKVNLVQSKSLMERLQDSIMRYHNMVITAAEFIDELIAYGKSIQEMDKEPEEMGLSEYEYAFYTAVADNDSARELMEKDKLRELAVVLFEKVKQNASIDWTIKESVRAKLKVIVKRTLRKYGYPPDMQRLATEIVLKQAEMLADELVG